jgi:hypothetical protein
VIAACGHLFDQLAELRPSLLDADEPLHGPTIP